MTSQKQLPCTEELEHTSATIQRKVSTVPVSPTLAYFQVEHQVDLPEGVPASLREHFKPALTSGFARPADVIAFLDDEALTIEPVPRVHIVPPAFREMAQREGFMNAFTAFQPAIVAKADHLDDLRAGRIDLDDIVQIEISSHMLFDRNDDVLPVGVYFDYTNGGFHSGRYHLDRALEVLSKDPRVTPVPMRRAADTGALSITRVGDHFSTDDYEQRHIAFKFAPTLEDMRAIWKQCQCYGENHPSTMIRQVMFELDILGLSASGAAKYSGYWGQDCPPDEVEEE